MHNEYYYVYIIQDNEESIKLKRRLNVDANSVTIVTGGGRGIGRTIALRMAEETTVVIVGRTRSDLVTTRAEIALKNAWAGYLIGDVADPAITAKSGNIFTAFKVRNLICNAGIGIGGPTETYSTADWKRMFDVNVHGAFYFIQAFLPKMIENGGGTICLISSTAGLSGLKRGMAYSATKHALVGMVKSLSLEHAKHGIRCVAICPNFVEGGMTDRTIKNIAKYHKISEDEARQIIISSTPEKRLISQEEVAEVIATICGGSPIPKNNVVVINGEKS